MKTCYPLLRYPPVSSSFFKTVYPRPFLLAVILVFLRPSPSVCEKHRVTQHPNFGSPVLVVLVGQILHETGFVFGTYQAFVKTNLLMRVVVMPE
jgi:hypothetical protein